MQDQFTFKSFIYEFNSQYSRQNTNTRKKKGTQNTKHNDENSLRLKQN